MSHFRINHAPLVKRALAAAASETASVGILAATSPAGNSTGHPASGSPPHKKAPDLTTARNIMIAFAGILLLCMLAQMARFCTRAYASLGEAKRPAPLRDDPLPPLSAINSATFLTGKAQLRARSRRTVGGGGLLQGWFLRKGEVTALMTPRSDQEPESAKGNPLVTSGFPVAQSGLARFVPPSHVQPPLEHLPWSRYLTFTPFSISWLPKPFASTLNIPQIVIVLLYLAVCLTALLWKADNTAPLPGKPEGPDYRRTGTVALVNIPVAVALGVRGNLIGMVIGRGYEKLKTFHKIAGRVCFITATIHIAYFAAKWTWNGKIMENSRKPKYISGWLGWAALLLLAVSSLPWIRKRWFTLFEACHAIGILLFIGGTAMHVPVAQPWCVASGGIYVLSMLISAVKTKIVRAEILALTPSDSTVITMPSLRSGWRAGQHVRIRIPALGLRLGYEGHPFTIASAPDTEGLVLMCKNTGDWTRALHRLASKSPTASEAGSASTDVTVIVEGPHGGLGNTLLPSFSSVMLVAGGSGITHSLGLAHDLISRASTGAVRARTIDLVWVVRAEDIVRPLLPTLLDMVNDAKASELACLTSFLAGAPTALRIHIYVTRSASSPLTLEQVPSPTIELSQKPRVPALPELVYNKRALDSEYELQQISRPEDFVEPATQRERGPFSPYGQAFTVNDQPLSSLVAYPERPNFDTLVGSLVHEVIERHAMARTDASGVCVAACGPLSMVHGVNEAVKRIDADQRRVIGGLEFEEECFQY